LTCFGFVSVFVVDGN